MVLIFLNQRTRKYVLLFYFISRCDIVRLYRLNQCKCKCKCKSILLSVWRLPLTWPTRVASLFIILYRAISLQWFVILIVYLRFVFILTDISISSLIRPSYRFQAQRKKVVARLNLRRKSWFATGNVISLFDGNT